MKKFILFFTVILATGFHSCKKFLEAKPDAKLAIPMSLGDLQSILDYYREMNAQYPVGSIILADNYFVTSDDWASIYWEYQRHYYIWQKDDTYIGDWAAAYKSIYNCNLVLETLPTFKLTPADVQIADNIKGSALFFRASYFYSLAQLYANGYDPSSSDEIPGIPLRITTDFTIKPFRASLEETYAQIISDLKKSIDLLPRTTSINSRPTKAAAYGFLARTYLAMQDYEMAGIYADSCLSQYSVLIDYNTLDTNEANPFNPLNSEVIFQAVTSSASILQPDVCKIDSILYLSYDSNDLRKALFFMDNNDGTFSFKGNYGGSDNAGSAFVGIVTDEQYLIKAECEVRLGRTENAIECLNSLLKKRYKNGNHPQIANEDQLEVLRCILDERRKELIFRGCRWADLRRLNMDVRFADTLTRQIDGTIYHLLPGDNRYAAQIPHLVVEQSGLQQNP